MDVYRQIGPDEERRDGARYEVFLDRGGQQPRARMLYTSSNDALPRLDDLAHLGIYAARIGIFDVKVAEFRPSDRQKDDGGYQSWGDRAGLFRSVGDGAVECECAPKHSEDGGRGGAAFARHHVIRATDRARDGFNRAAYDEAVNHNHRRRGRGR